MIWLRQSGQAAVEAAMVIPLLLLLMLGIVTFGYGGLAQLLVVTSAAQGARLGAALCGDGRPYEEVMDQSRQRALTVMSPLVGPKGATPYFDGTDLVVVSAYTYTPPLPGAKHIFGGSIHYNYSARYRCR